MCLWGEIALVVHRSRFTVVWLIPLFILVVGCGTDDAPADTPDVGVDLALDTRPQPDLGQDMPIVADLGPDLADMGQTLPTTASNYCELTVDMFCDYYLRCGRMAESTIEACRATFLETCNSVYEPIYTAYETAGQLALSESGIATCRAHLQTVECQKQTLDLDGACSGMWQGQQPAQAACNIGIGSFVCAEGTTCRIGIDLCGTCEPAGAAGAACDADNRCLPTHECVNATCVARALPGESCENVSCVVGISCENNVCVGRNIVALGEACDGARRCPYKSDCIGGVCVEAGLQGEACTDNGCASGFCDGTVCQPLRDEFAGCTQNFQCLSGRCNGQFCEAIVSECTP